MHTADIFWGYWERKQIYSYATWGIQANRNYTKQFSKNLSSVRNPISFPLCNFSTPPSSSLHVLESRPLQQKQACFSNLKDSPMGYTFPPLSLIGSNTNVADKALVSMIPSTDNEKSPLLLPKIHNLLISANPENHYLIEKRKLQLLASTFYRENYL